MHIDSIKLDDKDCIERDLHNLTDAQAKFNKWFNEWFHFHGIECFLAQPVKLSKSKCIGWRLMPESMLGCERHHFKGWKIGHCLNCDADPYDGQVEAWSYDGGIEGALVRCNKCKQLRWQNAYHKYEEDIFRKIKRVLAIGG